MDADSIQARIDRINYWDMWVLDFRVLYFGDEIELYLEDTDKLGYRITFLHCLKLSYENAEARSNETPIRDLSRVQLSYSAQGIVVENSQENGFFEFRLVLPFLFATVTCRDIEITQIDIAKENFFWQVNELKDSSHSIENH